MSAADVQELLDAEARGREGSAAPAGGGAAELAYRLGLAAWMLALAQRAAEPGGDPWTGESFALAEAAIRIDAARALTYATAPGDELASACAAAAVHAALAGAAQDAVALLAHPTVAGEAAAALAAVQPILAADPRGETALEAVAATVIDDGASLMELP